MEMITWNIYLLVLDGNTWNNILVCKLFVLDKNILII